MQIEVIRKWSDLNVGRFVEISSVLKTEYDDEMEKGVALVSAAYGIDARNIAFNDFKTLSATLALLDTQITPNKVKSTYEMNGNEYVLNVNHVDFTTAQYMDMISAQKKNDTITFLSVVLLPKGKIYMDGYDITKVKDDICSMNICDAVGIINFFQISSTAFIQLLVTYFRKRMKKLLRKKKVKKKELEQKMKRLETMIGEFYLIL